MPSEETDLSAGAEPTPGDVLCERYRLAEKLGSGAFGQVFAADDLREERRVAIKVLRAGAGQRDPDAVARLRQEAEILEAIKHPHIVEIYEVGHSDFGLFMVMELLEGKSIDQLLVAEGPAEPARVARVTRQLLSALATAHARGVLHRDLKPENIMLIKGGDAQREQAKLVDFGIAKAREILDENPEEGVTLVKTRGGGFMGTPRYCAPETVVGDPVEPSADIFSLGLVLAEWLTGRERITAEKHNQALGILIQPEPLDVSDCPENWQPWLAEMIAKDPADRYPTATEALAQFDAIVGEQGADKIISETLISAADRGEFDEGETFEMPGALLREGFVSDTAETEVRDIPSMAELAAARERIQVESARSPQPDAPPAPAERGDTQTQSPPDTTDSFGQKITTFFLVALASAAAMALLLWLWREFF